MKHTFLLSLLLSASLATFATGDSISVKQAKIAGPFSLKQPIIIDSISAGQAKYSEEKLFETPLSANAADNMPTRNLSSLNLKKGTLNLASFSVKAKSYVKAKIETKGTKRCKIYCDGAVAEGTVSMAPGEHTLAVKFIADSTAIDICIKNAGEKSKDNASFPLAVCQTSEGVAFGMAQNLGTRVTRYATLSASGKWALVSYSWYDERNEVQRRTELCDLTTGKNVCVDKADGWMPLSDKYYFQEKIDGKTRLVTVDPMSGARDILVADLPEEGFEFSPAEDFLILYSKDKGPEKEKEDKGRFHYLEFLV